MSGTLNVDTGSLNGVGNSISDVAAQVRDIYTKLQNTINAVTANDSWKGAASSAFLEKFEAIRPEFERDLATSLSAVRETNGRKPTPCTMP